jgi:hypothetical protein
MTLQQFFEWVQSQPSIILYYFLLLLVITLIGAMYSSKDERQLTPWNWIFAVIIYLVCIPGIFAITLSIYFFLFEKRSIMDTELLLQVLPIIMMFIILYIISKSMNFKYIPGFDKISSLIVIIGVILCLMWVLDRTQLYAISFVPFYYVLIMLIGAIFALRIATKKMMS